MVASLSGPISDNSLKPRRTPLPETAFPILPVAAKLSVPILAIVLNPKESRHRALHGVANVVHQKRIAIGPSMQTID